MFKLMRSVRFLVMGPVILAFLFAINLMTSPGDWWVQWPALGIGIAWVISLIRVITAAVAVGGVAALVTYFSRR
ncbi:MAG: 2TM domain-containing protein [Thermoanaerobaculia bacterium]